MHVEDFNFHLPESLIAQTPLLDRASSRLMTLHKITGEIGHHTFADLARLLQPGDTLVLNDTKVLPARLFGMKRGGGGNVEILLLKSLGEDRWETLVRPGRRLKVGAMIDFGDLNAEPFRPVMTAHVEQELEDGGRIIRFEYSGIFNEWLEQLGHMPLPPYIKETLADRDRYQTVYAEHPGSAAAPTAGLHFTDELLQIIRDKGISIAFLTLHVGLGTFRPVSVEQITDHHMHAEYYEVSAETAKLLNETKARGGRIIAVGTTSTRTLETVAAKFPEGSIEAASGWTDIFIYPGYQFRLVDALVTNFHLPKSTLLMLISALAGRDHVLRAYAKAVEENYRFFSFGDAMFIYTD